MLLSKGTKQNPNKKKDISTEAWLGSNMYPGDQQVSDISTIPLFPTVQTALKH